LEKLYQIYGPDLSILMQLYCVVIIPGTEISRIKRNYVENQSRRTTQLKSLNSDLQEVKHIMFENIEAVLQRGELIESLRNCLIGR
jgi:hypothetical protein